MKYVVCVSAVLCATAFIAIGIAMPEPSHRGYAVMSMNGDAR